MLKRIGLTNFQGFKGTQEVAIAPITIIFGPNASGKSSIGRALRLLRQSGPTDNKSSEGGRLTFSGEDIDGNSFENMKFGQSSPGSPSNLAIEVTGVLSSKDPSTQVFDSYSCQTEVTLENWGSWEQGNHVVNKTTLYFRDLVHEGEPVSLTLAAYSGSIEGDVECHPKSAWPKIEGLLNDFCKTAPFEWDSREVSDLEDFDPDYVEEVSWANLLVDTWIYQVYDNVVHVKHPNGLEGQSWIEKHKLGVLSNELHNARTSFRRDFRALKHIRPFRDVPERIQVRGKIEFEHDENTKANEWLSKLTDGRYQVISARNNFESEVNTFEVTENYVKDLFTNVAIGFDEVGTGISQVFPILSELFSSPESYANETGSKFLLIEQPELHLHPRMQGDLADAVIAAVKDNPWETQVILETHSENMLLRLQKRIREGKLSKDDVAIVFVEPSDAQDPSKKFNLMSNLELDSMGDVIDPFPISFASLRLEDLL